MDKYIERMKMTLPLPGGRTFELKNPILTASGTFGYGVEFSNYGDLSTLGGIVSKGLSLEPRNGNPTPRICETTAGMLNAVGLQNCGLYYFLDKYLSQLPADTLPVIVNMYADNIADFSSLAEKLSCVPGIAALEINISCPNVSHGGVIFGQDPVAAAKVTEAVKKNARDLPVIVKLSPNVTDITEIARACEAGGADIISCINTLTGLAVDLNKRTPLLANITGGLSGPCIKPVALRCVWQVAKSVDIPVIGIGGISSATDVLEFLMVGAYAVQIGTANFGSPDNVFSILQDLKEQMDILKIDKLMDFRNTLTY